MVTNLNQNLLRDRTFILYTKREARATLAMHLRNEVDNGTVKQRSGSVRGGIEGYRDGLPCGSKCDGSGAEAAIWSTRSTFRPHGKASRLTRWPGLFRNRKLAEEESREGSASGLGCTLSAWPGRGALVAYPTSRAFSFLASISKSARSTSSIRISGYWRRIASTCRSFRVIRWGFFVVTSI